MKLPLAIAALALAFGAAPTRAADAPHDHANHTMPSAEKPSTTKVRFDDAVLVDQEGVARKLRSEVIGDRIVVIDFAYTTCTTVCPVLTALMAKVQRSLAESGQSDVQLLTITVDPARDTPARLKSYAAQYGAQPGWIWLTGPTGRVNEVLKGFGAYSARFEDHPALMLVGDPKSGNWTRFVGFADPQDLLAKVDELQAARDTNKQASHQH